MKQTNFSQTHGNQPSAKKPKPWLRTALLVLIAVVLGFGIYNWNAASLSRNALPMPLGFGMAVVVSGSMEPALSVNDLIVVAPAEAYDVGDIVVFQDGNTLVVHRMISANGDSVVTQGDANNTPDQPISPDAIKGRVVFSLPLVGVLVSFLKSATGTLAVLALAVWLYARSVRRERRADAQKMDEIRSEIEKLKKK